MRIKRRAILWLTILGLAVASLLMLAACGGSVETTSTSAVAATTASTEATTGATSTSAVPATAASTEATTGEGVVIRVTTPVPAGDVFIEWAQEGFDRFNARMNGAYTLKLFPGAALAPLPESLDAIRTGSIEAGMIPFGAFAGSVPEFGVPELPFMFDTHEAGAYAAPALQALYDELTQERANQRTLGYMFCGTMELLSKKKLVKSLDDLKGLVIGVANPPGQKLLEALGSSGLVVSFVDDYSNLQKGVMDARMTGPQNVFIGALYEVAKYYTVFRPQSGFYAFTVNSDFYNKMPQDAQTALVEELSATAKSVSENYVRTLAEFQPVLEKEGVEYYFLPAAERDKWAALGASLALEGITKAGDIGAQIKQIVDEANAKFPSQD